MSSVWWTRKLEKRLLGLTDSASRESIQALAKWIGFNRKHGHAFASSLADVIGNANTSSRQLLLLQVVHEALILDNKVGYKWDRLSDLRKTLGENTVISVAPKLGQHENTKKAVDGMVKQWDELNVFGGPTLVAQIRRLLSTPSTRDSKKVTPSAVATPSIAGKETSTPRKLSEEKQEEEEGGGQEPMIAEAKKEVTAEKQEKLSANDDSINAKTASENSKMITAAQKISKQQSSSKAHDTSYDFEAKGIPYGKVEGRDFLDPCKAITALQISRDLSNDTAVQLSALLSSLPEDIKQTCEEAEKFVQSTGEAFELSEEKASSFAVRTSEELLDKNMDDALQSVRTFLGIIHKQREARERLMHLLIRSRCEFGAKESAQAFYNMDETINQLQKRKETLRDAMELEGLDFEEQEMKETANSQEEKLEEFSWCPKQKTDTKRARTD